MRILSIKYRRFIATLLGSSFIAQISFVGLAHAQAARFVNMDWQAINTNTRSSCVNSASNFLRDREGDLRNVNSSTSIATATVRRNPDITVMIICSTNGQEAMMSIIGPGTSVGEMDDLMAKLVPLFQRELLK